MPHDRPESEPTRPGGSEDVLRRLEERLDRASSAAEQLLADAAGAAARRAAATRRSTESPPTSDGASEEPQSPPPAGWQLPPSEEPDERPRDLELVVAVLRSVRDLIPPELERRLAEALRELLLALRALIDWYLERAEQRRREPAEVQDIPIA